MNIALVGPPNAPELSGYQPSFRNQTAWRRRQLQLLVRWRDKMLMSFAVT